MLAALQNVERMRLVVVTAPSLPWDEARCRHELPCVCKHQARYGGHCAKCRGCRVVDADRERWEARARSQWRHLWDAIRKQLRRDGLACPLIAWALEDQARGVLHRNCVLQETGRATTRTHALLRQLAPRYGFGFVQRDSTAHPKANKQPRRTGREAAFYLSGYLAMRDKGGATLLELARRTDSERRLHWISPTLTSRTRCTIRSQRNGRRAWAVEQGLCDPRPLRIRVEVWTNAVQQTAAGDGHYVSRRGPPKRETRDCELDIAGSWECRDGRVWNRASGELLIENLWARDVDELGELDVAAV